MNETARKYRYLPLVALAVVVLLAGGGLFWLVRSYINSAPAPTKKVVQEIHVIRPPPPPPDQPPPPPPPPKEEEKVEVPDPQQQPDPTPSNEPPPGEQLGLDAEGSAGGDAFGLLGNKGGRELLASGGGSVAAWYAGLIKNEILDQLAENKEVRKGEYKINLQLWLRSDGSVEKAHMLKSSGDANRDRAIEAAAQRLKFSKPPPPEVPQPLTLTWAVHS